MLGEERLRALKAFKAEIDPRGIMNPGKVLGSGAIDLLMGTASAFEALVRPIANAATAPTGDMVGAEEVNGIPADVAFYAYSCAQCGYCVHTCEEYSGRGWMSHSPRGKYLYLRDVMEGREKFDQKMVDTFLVCTTCEVCNTRCQLQLPVEHSWMTMRGRLVQDESRMTFPPFEMMAASLRGENGIFGKTWVQVSGRKMRLVSGHARKVPAGRKGAKGGPVRVIEIIDLLEKPQLAAGDQIVAIPTLVRRLPQLR